MLVAKAFSWSPELYAGLLFAFLGGIGVLGVAWMLWARGQAPSRELRIGRIYLHLTERSGGRVVREERVMLQDIVGAEAVEDSMQRPTLVTRIVGRNPWRVPMEQHTIEAVRWLAAQLVTAGHATRQ